VTFGYHRAVARILLLDDSALVLNATREALEPAGHQLTCVGEPAAFFTALSTAEPELALVDVSMPTLEGDAVVWIARAHQLHGCRIVLYSAKSEAELEALVRSSGADGFICKTGDDERLRREVAKMLALPLNLKSSSSSPG
jgi:DNA-binding response OmpR family regulator